MKARNGRELARRRTTRRELGTIFTNGLFFKNPVLIGALGLYPVVAAGYNLRAAVELSLLLFLIAVPTGLAFCLIGGLMPSWLRPGAVLAVSALFYMPAAWGLNQVFPGSVNTLGIFAGLIICNSMLLSRCNDYAPFHLARAVLADVLGSTAGYSLVLCGFASLREFLQRGSVWNSHAGTYIAADKGTSLPFFGFLLLGFAAAFTKWADGRRGKKANQAERKVPRP